MTLEQETVVNPNPVKSWSIAFWVPDGVWSFQDSRELVSLVSLSLLVKVVMPPGAWASSVSAVPIKNCGAASTENVKLAPFEMVISIGFEVLHTKSRSNSVSLPQAHVLSYVDASGMNCMCCLSIEIT